VDTVLYVRIVRLSDKLYNQGLARLKAGDIHYGMEALAKSIAINKNNVSSRNLLGLALYETGHIGEALKQWVISQSMLEEDNPATKYIELANKNSRQLERLNDAVGMFNQALGHIKHKSDDLAIIQLKKAVEINSHFVDALNLLTLCYLIQNDRDRATYAAERVLAFDANNPIALNYYAILNPGKQRPSSRAASKPIGPKSTTEVKGPYMPVEIGEKKRRNFHLAEMIAFLIGVLVTGLICYFLIIPDRDDRSAVYLQQAEQNLLDERAAHLAELHEVITARDDLQHNLTYLEEQMSELRLDRDAERRINHVNQAYWAYRNEDHRRAVDLITMLDDFERAQLPPDMRDHIETITEGSYPVLGVSYYTEGLSYFNANNFYGALPNLENAEHFLPDDATQRNMLLFMLGTIYYQHNRIDEAYDTLTTLRDRAAAANFPGFTGAQRTAFSNMLNSVTAQR